MSCNAQPIRHALLRTSHVHDMWRAYDMATGKAAFAAGQTAQVSAACQWSSSQPGLSALLMEHMGSRALSLVPVSVAAETVGKMAALSWLRLLPMAAAGDQAYTSTLLEVIGQLDCLV